MSRVQQSGRETAPTGFIQQIGFDRGFPAAVLAERPPRLLFRGGHLHTVPVYPYRSTMQEMLEPSPQRFDELSRALLCEANQIDHRVRMQVRDARTERPSGFL
jgi:hypothetical protein